MDDRKTAEMKKVISLANQNFDMKGSGHISMQIVTLTKTIHDLSLHCKNNKSDHSASRRLRSIVARRNSLLKCIARVNSEKHKALMTTLLDQGYFTITV